MATFIAFLENLYLFRVLQCHGFFKHMLEGGHKASDDVHILSTYFCSDGMDTVPTFVVIMCRDAIFRVRFEISEPNPRPGQLGQLPFHPMDPRWLRQSTPAH